jgi:hypothetical protein
MQDYPEVYEALQDTRSDGEQLMKLYIAQIGSSEPIVLAGDPTSWFRPFAQTLQEHLRTFPFTIRKSSDRPGG